MELQSEILSEFVLCLCGTLNILECNCFIIVRLWSVQSQTSLVEYKGHNYPVWAISTGCKGSYFVSASQDHTARLWTTEYAFPLRIFAGHLNSVDVSFPSY